MSTLDPDPALDVEGGAPPGPHILMRRLRGEITMEQAEEDLLEGYLAFVCLLFVLYISPGGSVSRSFPVSACEPNIAFR